MTVSDIANGSAKSVNVEHGLPPCGRQDPHGHIERATDCRQHRLVFELSYGDRFRMRHRPSYCACHLSTEEQAIRNRRQHSKAILDVTCLRATQRYKNRCFKFLYYVRPSCNTESLINQSPV